MEGISHPPYWLFWLLKLHIGLQAICKPFQEQDSFQYQSLTDPWKATTVLFSVDFNISFFFSFTVSIISFLLIISSFIFSQKSHSTWILNQKFPPLNLLFQLPFHLQFTFSFHIFNQIFYIIEVSISVSKPIAAYYSSFQVNCSLHLTFHFNLFCIYI